MHSRVPLSTYRLQFSSQFSLLNILWAIISCPMAA
jgi:hypothetical protein